MASREITILTRSNKRCGPVNVAVLLYKNLVTLGQDVRIFCLNQQVGSSHGNVNRVALIHLLGTAFKRKNYVLNTHGIRPDLCGFFLRNLNRHCSWVSTVHIDIFEDMSSNYGLAGKIASWVWLGILRRADGVVFLNQYLCDKYRAYGLSTLVIHNAVDEKGDGPPLNGAPVFGYVGNFIALKNVNVIPEVLPNGSQLHVAGDGPLKAEFLERAARAGLDVIDHGFVDDVSEVLAKVNILILPSKTEAMPLVVLEAASSGVPSIVRDLPQYAGVFDDFTVRLGAFTDENFSVAVSLICERYVEFRERSREAWKAQFQPSVMAARYLELFRKFRHE